MRDLGLLESALSQPQATFDGQWLHAFPFEMAAAYLFHIVQNHPFIDGNKRTGAVAALLFLDLNGVDRTVTGLHRFSRPVQLTTLPPLQGAAAHEVAAESQSESGCFSQSGGALSGTRECHCLAALDPDLQRLIQVWDHITPEMHEQIAEMIRGVPEATSE